MKISVRTSFSCGRRPDVHPRARLPRGRGFTRGQVFTVRGRDENRVRAEAGPRGAGPHTRGCADVARTRPLGRRAASAQTHGHGGQNF
jgi:hypothetical protein